MKAVASPPMLLPSLTPPFWSQQEMGLSGTQGRAWARDFIDSKALI